MDCLNELTAAEPIKVEDWNLLLLIKDAVITLLQVLRKLVREARRKFGHPNPPQGRQLADINEKDIKELAIRYYYPPEL